MSVKPSLYSATDLVFILLGSRFSTLTWVRLNLGTSYQSTLGPNTVLNVLGELVRHPQATKNLSFFLSGSSYLDSKRSLAKPKLAAESANPSTVPQAASDNRVHKALRLRDGFVRTLLYRFLTSLFGANVYICLFRNLQKELTVVEMVSIKLQQHRIFLLNPVQLRTQKQKDKYQWKNSFMAVYLSVKYRDPMLLLNWLKDRLRFMSMFSHLRFFRILGLILKLTTKDPFGSYKLRGFSFYLVGKISVTGNAMSRSYRSFAGKRSNSSLALRLASQFFLVRTPTGCLGFTLSYFF